MLSNFVKYYIDQLFTTKTECFHSKISSNSIAAYCPDCGEYIENQWYLTRCKCCGLKQKSVILKGKICPQNNFCINCGSNKFLIEKIDKINFIDINYSVLIKEAIDQNKESFTQCWEEKGSERIKLLASKLL
jgi:hypothetical protein